MADEIQNAIVQNASGPKKVKSDAGEVEQHSIAEQIEADRYLASRRAASCNGLGLKVSKLASAGA